MKFTFSILTILFCAAAASAQTFAQAPAPIGPMRIEIDGYAAKVNQRVITRGEVRELLAPLLPELYRNFQDQELEQELEKAFSNARNQLIDRALILHAFEERGGQIPDQYVNDEIKRIIKERFKGDAALFEQVLSDQKKTREEYMDELREQMAVSSMVSEEVTRRARITPEQVRDEYEAHLEKYAIPEKVKYSVIVLNKGTTEEDLAVKLQEAESIRQRLIDGADFAETAKNVSEGSRAADGGAFPWMQPKDVRPELQEILSSLPAGEISEIIETDLEFYLLKVEARRLSGVKSFDEVRLSIKTMLTNKERARLHARWIDRLKATNYILIYERPDAPPQT